MEIDEFDEPKISFDMDFEKDMNLNINNHKNEVDLYLMESL